MVQQLFHGTDDQKIYYELGGDKAQIYDIGIGDVRSEGQSYGMLMAVQMDLRSEFDKLWSYAASCMRQSNGTFAWKMQQGACTAKETGFAPDGEEYFAMALLLASRRWDTSTGFDYGVEAKKVMKAPGQGAGRTFVGAASSSGLTPRRNPRLLERWDVQTDART